MDDPNRNPLSIWRHPVHLLSASNESIIESTSLRAFLLFEPGMDDAILGTTYMDSISGLPAEILGMIDCVAMAIGLESRMPFLVHRVVEATGGLPIAVLVGDGQGKWALQQLQHKYVSRGSIERPGAGFETPVGAAWMAPRFV